MIPRRERAADQFSLVGSVLRSGDITFGQLERPLSTGRATSVPHRDPHANASLLAAVGFDVMSFAGNHVAEWGPEAIIETIDATAAVGLPIIGAGLDIEQARRPAIVERGGTTVGFLAYCSVVPDGHEATAERFGSVPLRATTTYEQWDWQAGTPPRIVTRCFPDDLAAMVADVEQLRRKVDVLVVSCHWGVHFVPAVVATYQREAAHAAIDAGADLVLGHHAHILKPVEVHRGKAIVYSMGNFAVDIPYERMVRTEFPQEYRFELDPDYQTYAQPFDARKSIVVRAEVVAGEIRQVGVLPCWIGPDARPESLAPPDQRSDQVLHYLETIGRLERIHTRFRPDGDVIVVDTTRDSEVGLPVHIDRQSQTPARTLE